MMRRLSITAWGTVQGVGFRPFVYAAATERSLSGWVRNTTQAVRLEVQGGDEALADFLRALRCPPPAAHLERIETVEVPIDEQPGFRILESTTDEQVMPTLPADLAPCDACIAEMEDETARRFGYPFINCTECGPRYSIALALPYDRANTCMRDFALCDACARQYRDPTDRRFHAEPIACPACGPHVSLLTPSGRVEGTEAIRGAARALLRGEILACKGLGGFQLLVDATDEAAVLRLRARKRREEKPFAVMFPSLETALEHCLLPEAAQALLQSPAAPILLVRRRNTARIAEAVAPRNPFLGAMLPSTPLHRLLLAGACRPLVCTSGNLSEEPMCTGEQEARDRLGTIADLFLVHDRPIARPLDDSVARIDSCGLQLLRRARGFAPLPLPLASLGGTCILATGGHLKSTVALGKGGQVLVSQHLGDLSSVEGRLLLERTAKDLLAFFRAEPELLACDLHPDYASTRLAERFADTMKVPLERVQHHHAHVAACMAEHGLQGPVLGLAWDGAGLGSDGTIWGGEALLVRGASFERVAHLRPFSLPGGEAALRNPSRSALGLLYEIFGAEAMGAIAIEPATARALLSMLASNTHCPRTSSMGRLFDAVAALSGVCSRSSYEGQAALELEHAADGASDERGYPFPLREGEPAIADWEPLVRALLEDSARAVPASLLAARFHRALVDLAEAIAERTGTGTVVLTGGCFQNLRLLESVRARLRRRGLQVHTPRAFPPNDGGLALGQLYVAACRKGALTCA